MADGKVFYKHIAATEVEPAKLREAERILPIVEKRLSLPPVEIKWIREICETEFNVLDSMAAVKKAWEALGNVLAGRPDYSHKYVDGFVNEEAIGGMATPASGQAYFYLNSDEPLERLALIVAHECQHLRDWADGLQAGLYADPEVRRRLERRAEAFGRAIEKELREGRR